MLSFDGRISLRIDLGKFKPQRLFVLSLGLVLALRKLKRIISFGIDCSR